MRILALTLVLFGPTWNLASPSPIESLELSRTTGKEGLFVVIDQCLSQFGISQGKKEDVREFSRHLTYPKIDTWKYYTRIYKKKDELVPYYTASEDGSIETAFGMHRNPRYKKIDEFMIGFDSDLNLIFSYTEITIHERFVGINHELPKKYDELIESLTAIVTNYSNQQVDSMSAGAPIESP